MYLTYVRHRVKDYAQWRKAFDHNARMLFDKFGVLSTGMTSAALTVQLSTKEN